MGMEALEGPFRMQGRVTRVAPRSAELTLLGALITAHSSSGARFTDMYIRILYNTDMYTEPHTIYDTQRDVLWAI